MSLPSTRQPQPSLPRADVDVRTIASVFVALIVVAGLGVAFKPGSSAPAVLTAGGTAGSNLIKAASTGG